MRMPNSIWRRINRCRLDRDHRGEESCAHYTIRIKCLFHCEVEIAWFWATTSNHEAFIHWDQKLAALAGGSVAVNGRADRHRARAREVLKIGMEKGRHE